ncbi:MAG: GHKL domain-containing protein, partial [Deltaproteobacteria bacterium]|nr:GHKL domain-containing protein [Deltaproteobacteria bacterium]
EAYAHQKAAQSQMVHQEKMASIGQLAAGVAHEINNPTGFITSNLSSLGKYAAKLNQHITFLEEIIAKQQDTEISAAVQQHQKQLKLSFVQDDIKDLIEESLEGAERIKTIVQNLKSFSRVDDTGMSNANLQQCLDSALSIGQNEIKYKATITKDYQDIPDCNCNAQQLNQVFLNLLVNAAQAMEQPGTITIQTLTEGSWIVIKISDDGTGIEPEFLSRIFEPFFTTKDVGKGTGLGLSICYDIIQKHHGEITVVSEVGQGTNFTIKLPISAPELNEHSEG